MCTISSEGMHCAMDMMGKYKERRKEKGKKTLQNQKGEVTRGERERERQANAFLIAAKKE